MNLTHILVSERDTLVRELRRKDSFEHKDTKTHCINKKQVPTQFSTQTEQSPIQFN